LLGNKPPWAKTNSPERKQTALSEKNVSDPKKKGDSVTLFIEVKTVTQALAVIF
jgi:hypothetical protein